MRLRPLPGTHCRRRARRPLLCFHCGRPNALPSRWRAEWNGAAHTFCCAGCLGVARTIHAAGLDDFYEQRTVGAGTRAGGDRRARRLVALGRDRGGGGTRAGGTGRHARMLAPRRRHPLRCVHLPHRIVSRAAGGCGRGQRQLRDATRAGRLRSRSHAAVGRSACRGCDRLSREPVRSRAARDRGALRSADAAAAACGGGARDDAGDDVRGADLRHGRWRRAGPSAVARMGEPHAHVAGTPLFRGAFLPRRMARPQASARGHGRAGGAGTRRGLRRQRMGDVRWRRCGLLRLGHDVHRAAPGGALRRARGATARGRRDRGGRHGRVRRRPSDFPGGRRGATSKR